MPALALKIYKFEPVTHTVNMPQLKQLTQIQTHPLHDLNAHSDPPTNTKATIFHNNDHINIIISEPNITPEECRKKPQAHLQYHHLTIPQF